MFDLAGLRPILETALDAVVVMDAAGRIADWNARAEATFGWPRQDAVGQSLADLIIPHRYRARHEASLARYLESGIPTVQGRLLELSAIKQDGTEIPVELSITATGPAEAPMFIGFIRDITERRRASTQLAQSESRLRMAGEAAGLGVWDWDLITDVLIYSDRAKAIYGLPVAEPVTSQIVRRATHPDDAMRMRGVTGRILDPELRARESYEGRIIRPDGAVRWLQGYGEAVFDTVDGVVRPVRYVGAIQDITESKLTEAALRASEARLRLALDAGRMAPWELDIATGTVEPSPELNRLLGFPPNHTPTPAEMAAGYPPGERDAVESAARSAFLRGERHFEAEYRFERRDGAMRWLLLRAEIVMDADGRPVRVLGVIIDVTDRKAVELAYRESEERLRALADNIPNGMIFQLAVAADGLQNFTFVSNSSERVNGVSAKALLNDTQSLYERVDPAFIPALEAAKAQALAAGSSFIFEMPMRGPDGEMRWFKMHAAPRPGPGGSTVWDGIQVDIHDQKLVEESLRASEARFRAAVEAVQGVIWTNNAAGEMIGDQPAWAALTGQTYDQYKGLGWTRAIHPDDVAPTIEAWTAAVAQNRTFLFEHRVRRHDGAWRTFSIRALPSLDGQGKIREWVGVHTDVTDERDAEQRLRILNETLEARVQERTLQRDRLWDLSEDLLVVADYDGHLLRVSPSWSRLLGYDEQTLMAHSYIDLVHPDDFSHIEGVLLEMRSTGKAVSIENRLRAADGGWRWCAWTISPDPGRERVTGVGRDVTAVKAHQAELQMAQEALRQSQKLEAMGQLTGGVAHDFNNLLTPIIGSLDMLLRRGLGGEREQRLMDGALQSAERAKVLVQRLLAFARKQPLQANAVDVAALIRGMADLIASTSGPKIRVLVDAPPDLPAAQADPNQLEMAILNLAVNARDAMPEGGSLTIAASSETLGPDHRSMLPPGTYVHLSVADTGVGMDEAALSRAVEPFFSTKGVGKGTGLGLSMVHGLASQLGGAILLSSRPGLGTNVELWLPISTRAAESGGRPGEGGSQAPGAGTALLVDDEDLVRMSTADMLIELGYGVVEMSSAEEALKALVGGLEVAVLVTDHLMPGMSGIDLAREVRGRRPGLPVLIISGFAEAEGIAPDLPRLTKPFRAADLAASLSDLMA